MKLDWMTAHIKKFFNKKENFFNNFDGIDYKHCLDIIKESEPLSPYMNDPYHRTSDLFFPGSNKRFYSYDEMVIILISWFDRDLSFYKQYLSLINKLDYIDCEKEIDFEYLKVNFPKEFEELCSKAGLVFFEKYKYNLTTTLLATNLIEFERIYYNKIIKKDNMPIKFDKNCFKNLVNSSIKDFTDISENKIYQLKTTIDERSYLSELGNYCYLLSWQLENVAEFFDNPSLKEKIIILILAIDPDLELLNTFYNISNWNEIKDYSINKFGFFEKNFIILEKLLNDKLKIIPDNPWQRTLK